MITWRYEFDICNMSDMLHVWLIVDSESMQKGPSGGANVFTMDYNLQEAFTTLMKHHETNAWTWKCFLSPESPLQTRALLCLYFPVAPLKWGRRSPDSQYSCSPTSQVAKRSQSVESNLRDSGSRRTPKGLGTIETEYQFESKYP